MTQHNGPASSKHNGYASVWGCVGRAGDRTDITYCHLPIRLMVCCLFFLFSFVLLTTAYLDIFCVSVSQQCHNGPPGNGMDGMGITGWSNVQERQWRIWQSPHTGLVAWKDHFLDHAHLCLLLLNWGFCRWWYFKVTCALSTNKVPTRIVTAYLNVWIWQAYFWSSSSSRTSYLITLPTSQLPMFRSFVSIQSFHIYLSRWCSVPCLDQ